MLLFKSAIFILQYIKLYFRFTLKTNFYNLKHKVKLPQCVLCDLLHGMMQKSLEALLGCEFAGRVRSASPFCFCSRRPRRPCFPNFRFAPPSSARCFPASRPSFHGWPDTIALFDLRSICSFRTPSKRTSTGSWPFRLVTVSLAETIWLRFSYFFFPLKKIALLHLVFKRSVVWK